MKTLYKKLIIPAIFITTFLKPETRSLFDEACQNHNEILQDFLNNTMQPQQLLDYANGTDLEYVLPLTPNQVLELRYVSYIISKAVISQNFSLFFPKVKNYPKVIKSFKHLESPSNTDTLSIAAEKLISTFQHLDKPVHSAVFSPDLEYILTTSMDNTAKLWDLKGNLIATFLHNGKVKSAVFSPDGTNILTTTSDNIATLWEIHPLWNSKKYTNYQLSLPELATILLVLKYKDFVKSNPIAQDIIEKTLNQIDNPVDWDWFLTPYHSGPGIQKTFMPFLNFFAPTKPTPIKNFFVEFLNS